MAQLPERPDRLPYEQEQVEVPSTSPLNTKPPESSEGPVLPLKALAEGLEVRLADLGILRELRRIGQRHEEETPFEGSEGASVDARETSEEVPATRSGQSPYPVSDAPTPTRTRTGLVPGHGVLEGEGRYIATY